MVSLRACQMGMLALCAFVLLTLSSSLLALDPSGDPDTSFNTTGFNVTNFNLVNTFAEGRGVGIQQLGGNAGKIVVGGGYQEGFNSHLALIRINPDGTLDGSFGNGGRVQTPVATFDLGNDVVIQSDDKIVLIGFSSNTTQDMVIARYTPDGALDTSFAGGAGFLNFEVAIGKFDRAHAGAVQSDGKIIVVGYCGDTGDATGRDFCLARFNTDGTFDQSFDGPSGSGNGRVRIAISPGNVQDRAWDVLVQPDGKIVVGGDARPGTNADFAMIRLNANGTLDSTWGTGGVTIVDMSTVGFRNDSLRGIERQSDGKIVAFGGGVVSQDGSSNDKISIVGARFNTNGTLDTSFGTGGKVSTILSSGFLTDMAMDVRVQGDGKLVVGALNGTSTGSNMALLRYNANGSLDTTYGVNGVRVVSTGGNDDLDAMVLDSSGRAVAVGYRTGAGGSALIAAARLTTTGALDTSFNGTGSLFTQMQGGSVDYASGVAVQTQAGNAGKAIVVGTTSTGSGTAFGITRYTTAGVLDTSFDGDGKATVTTGASDTARGVLVQPDDKIVVVGDSLSTPPNLTVARLNANGGLDTSFSGDGIAQVSLGTNASSGYAVARQADGKLVVAGTASNTAAEWNFAAVRFNANGSLDTSFNTTGSRIINLAAGAVDTAQAILLQPDGKIILGGYAFTGTGASEFVMIRLNANGSTDTSFGASGVVRTAFAGNTFSRSEIRSLALLPDGRIVAAGKHNDGQSGGSNNVFAVARYNSNGSLDTSFDGDGRKTSNFGADRFDEAFAVSVQFDEKLVLFGASQRVFVSNYEFALARYNWDDGSLDTTYGNSGVVLHALSTASDQAQAGLLLADGRQLAAGTAQGSDFGIARYRSDPAPTPAGTPDLIAASDTGRSSTDNITNDNTPTFTGSCVVGETAILRINGAETSPRIRHLCRTTSYTLTAPPLADGVHSITVQEINGRGAAAISPALSVTIDTQVSPPTITSPTNGSSVAIPPSPTISGAGAEANAEVEVRIGTTPVCSGFAALTPATNATWSCASSLGLGQHTITARQTDVAGNVSANSATVTFANKAQTTTQIVSDPNPSLFGETVTFTATVQTVPAGFATPAGTVNFVVDSVTIGSAALVGGVATFQTSSMAVGTRAVSAVFPETTSFFGSSGVLSGGHEVLEPLADLSISVTDGVTAAIPGNTLVYTIQVANAGPTYAPSASVTDNFPAGLSCGWTSVGSGGVTGNSNNPGPANLNDTGLFIPVGGTITYTVSCAISPAATGTLSNTATVATTIATDPAPGNNSATDADTVLTPQADVAVTKTDGASSAIPGQTIVYTMTVANSGPSNAPSVSVQDTFPAALTGCGWSSSASGGASGNSNNAGPANLAETLNLPASSQVTYTATCTIDPAATGTLVNTIAATSTVTDPTPGNNSATDSNTLTPEADISISKTDGAASSVPGDTVVYSIVVENAGPSNAPSVAVADNFPAILSGCGWISVASGGATGNGNNAGPANLLETLNMPAGSAVTYTATCEIEPDATGNLVNTATATSTTTDPTPGNNSATDSNTLTPQADLAISLSDGVTSAVPGTSLVYTIVASNTDGPSTVSDAVVSDTFPAALSCGWTSLASGGASGNSNNAGPANLVDTGLLMPPGSSITYTVSCDIDAGATGTLSNTASIASALVSDSNAGNNSATDADTVLTPQADIAVDKDDGVDGLPPGGTTTYTLLVDNLGPSDAPSVAFTDTFPAALLNCGWISVATGGATGNSNNAGPASVLSDTLNLPSDSAVVYTVDCDIDVAAVGTIVNEACSSSSVADPNSLNDCDSDVNAVQPLDFGDAPDSYATLRASDGARHVLGGALMLGALVDEELDGQPSIGADGDDTTGLADEDGVTFTTAFVACEPASVEVVAATAGGLLNAWIDWHADGDFAGPQDQVAVDLPLAAGLNALPLQVPCDAAPGTSYARFRISSESGLSFTGQAADGEVEDYVLIITAEGDLSVTKDDGLTTAIPGVTPVTYSIEAANVGPSPLAGVSLTDTFPAVLSCSWTSTASGGASGNTNNPGAAAMAELLDLPVNSSVLYTVSCSSDVQATGMLSNTVNIATTLANTSDPNLANNSATDATQLTPHADIAVSKSDGASSSVPGTPITYSIEVVNNGPNPDPAVAVIDNFPAALGNCAWTSVASGGATGNTSNPGALAISDNLSMPIGSSVAYSVSCSIAPDATGSLVNTVTASGSAIDPVPGNNAATDTNSLTPQADLGISKDDAQTDAVPGEPISYSIVASNAGPSTDPNVSVSDLFPASLTGCSYTSVASGGASGNDPGPGSGDLNDTGISMPPGSSVTWTVDCTIDSAATGILSNTATITASVTDPGPAPNSATDTTSLAPQADIAVSKSDGAATAVPGTPISYTVTVSNAGPSDDPAVQLADVFPASLANCSWTATASGGASGGLDGGPGTALNATLAMPAGSAVSYAVDCDILASASGSLVNTATATPSVPDPVSGNNSATDTNTLLRQADLAILKQASPGVVAGNDLLTYTLDVSNLGPSDAANVVITDVLPAEVSLISSSGCAADPAGLPACAIGTLAAGASAQVTLQVLVNAPPLPPQGFTNTATVSSDEADPQAANNSSSVLVSTDNIPPVVTAVETVIGPIAGCGPTLTTSVDAVAIVFSEAMSSANGGTPGPNHVENPANYRLFATGPDLDFSNARCTSPQPGDIAMTITSVVYSDDTPEAPESMATLTFDGGSDLVDGQYRLLVCGESGLRDVAGNPLDGQPGGTVGTDFVLDFRIDAGNVLRNAHFDCAETASALAPWQALPDAAANVARVADDSDGSPRSGSVNTVSSGASGLGIQQCAVLDEVRNPYQASAAVRVSTGPTAFLGLNLSCAYFASPDCSGDSLSASAFGIPLVDGGGGWFDWQASSGFNLPLGTASARCSLRVDSPTASAFEVGLDRLSVRSLVITPLFADGFESTSKARDQDSAQ